MAICLGLIDDYGVEQALSAHRFDEGALNSRKAIPEQVAEPLRALDHLFLANDFECANSNGTAKWVSAVG